MGVKHSSVVGSLICAMMCTKLDLDVYYIFGFANSFLSNPKLAHWKLIKQYTLIPQRHTWLSNGDLCLFGYSDIRVVI